MTKARTLADNFAADINAVTADAPLTGGGTSGTVTVGIQSGTTAQSGAVQLTDSTASTSNTTAATPNSVKSAYDLANGAIAKSTVDAKGDLLVGTANDTVSRLAVASTAGYLLSVDSAEATGLKWSAPAAAGGYTQLATGSLSGATTRIQSISADYRELVLIVKGFRPTNTTPKGRMYLRVNNDAGNNYWLGDVTGGINYPQICDQMSITDYTQSIVVATFPDYARTDTHHVYYGFTKYAYSPDPTGYNQFGRFAYTPSTSAAINEIDIFTSEGTWDSGSYILYGVK